MQNDQCQAAEDENSSRWPDATEEGKWGSMTVSLYTFITLCESGQMGLCGCEFVCMCEPGQMGLCDCEFVCVDQSKWGSVSLYV